MLTRRAILLLAAAALACAREGAAAAASTRSRHVGRTEIGAFNRTMAVYENTIEHSRLLLLLCPYPCPKERRVLPEMVRVFNEQAGYSPAERLPFHFYAGKRQLPFMNASIGRPTLAYVIGSEVVIYAGSISGKDDIIEWIASLDRQEILYPASSAAVDELLNTPNCSDKYLVYSPRDTCYIPHWLTLARIARLLFGIKTVNIGRPIRDHPFATVFYKRLPNFNENDCLLFAFIQLHSYAEIPTTVTPAQMAEVLSSLTTSNECVMVEGGVIPSHPIVPALSPLQMEYFSGERRLMHVGQSTAYLIVGASSGVAVIALAISIFWGLNGTAFASR